MFKTLAALFYMTWHYGTSRNWRALDKHTCVPGSDCQKSAIWLFLTFTTTNPNGENIWMNEILWPDCYHSFLLSWWLSCVRLSSLIYSQTQEPMHAYYNCLILIYFWSSVTNLQFTLAIRTVTWAVGSKLKNPMFWSEPCFLEGLQMSYFFHLSSRVTAAIKVRYFSNRLWWLAVLANSLGSICMAIWF